jgi:signal transduction histidine kinase/PAS domain-containing protein
MVLAGQSLVLLGSRYVGKRTLMRRLSDRLKTQLSEPIIELELPVAGATALEDQVEEKLRRALLDAGFEATPPTQAPRSFFQAIEKMSQHRQKPLILFASNIDGLSFQLAQSFLQGIRVQVEAGTLIVILSGERDFRDLVYGPNSEFNCANQFVIQGYEQEEFNKYCLEHSSILDIVFESPLTIAPQLWQLTGGSIHVLRSFLLWFVEKRMAVSGHKKQVVTSEDILSTKVLYDFSNLDGPLAGLYNRATQLIAEEPNCWRELMDLITESRTSIGWENHAPTQLELAGIAVRDQVEVANIELSFASPLVKSFINRHYDAWRFGNLYASVGDWARAFEQYSQVEPTKPSRAASFSERPEVRATVGALCSSLYSESTKCASYEDGIAAIKRLFIDGCRIVLGFSEISFWMYDAWRSEDGWRQVPVAEAPLREAQLELIKGLLPTPVDADWQFSSPWNRCALGIILPTYREGQHMAVVISQLETRAAISRERRRLVTSVLNHFAQAWSHVNRDYGIQRRLWTRDRHVEIMNSIFGALGSDVQNVGQVLEMAAKGLRELEYKRVLFSLVDPEGQRIRGLVDDNDSEPPADLASLIDCALSDYERDIQAMVIHERRSRQIFDAWKDPLVNVDLVNRSNLRSFALVPILNSSEKAIGTVHVERADEAMPSKVEVSDLEFFGRQLAIAIEQSERVNLLQSSLDKIPEPIVIVDRTERLRYANRPAAELLGVSDGWFPPDSDQREYREDVSNFTAQLLHSSLVTRNRLVSHFKGIGNDPQYRGAALTDIIDDWRGMTTGGLLRIQDFNYLHRVFLAARLIGEAQDTAAALSRMLQVAQQVLGLNKWGLLFLANDEDNALYLISKLSFGFSPEIEEKFAEGAVVLNRDPGGINWLTFELRRPVVFCWMENLRPNQTYVTSFGLQAINAPNPPQPDEIRIRPGDFWIDFPLIAEGRIIGKLCFQCDENLRPEDFELLKILSEFVTGLFDAFLLRATLVHDREKMITMSVAEKTIATMAHNLGTRLANLPFLLNRYRRLEQDVPALSEINDTFDHATSMAFETIKRAKEFFAPVTPHRRLIDLPALIEQTLGDAVPVGDWTLTCHQRPLELFLDYHLFETALLELIQNSKNAVADNVSVRISIDIEAESAKSDWVRLVYKDNGPGIRSDLQERIFDDFFSRRAGREAGTGLGMGMVRRVIEAQGGYVWVSRAIKGAEFIITLPKDAEDSPSMLASNKIQSVS